MSKKYFEELYLPPLVKAGNARAKRIQWARKATERNKQLRAAGHVFGNAFTKENAKENGSKGGKARFQNLDPEERRKRQLAAVAHMRASLSPEKRRAIAMAGSKASWNVTPEVRAERIARAMRNLERAKITKMGRRIPHWPFPDGPWMTRADAARRNGKISAAKARLRRFRTKK